MMDYLDKVAAGRSGVSPDGAVTDNMIGDRVGSEGIERMLSQKEELVGLMVRVIAETGIKPLCYMIRNQVMRHQDIVKDYKFKGKWIQVDPRKWSERSTTTVRVGTGSGNRKQQLAVLTQLSMAQTAIKQVPGQTLVTPVEEFNLLNDMAKAGGLTGAGPYFLDPATPKGQQNAQTISQNAQQAQQKQDAKDTSNLQAEIKFLNAQADAAMLKTQLENTKNQLKQQEQQATAQIAFLKQKLDEMKAVAEHKTKQDDLDFKYWDRKQYYTIEDKKLVTQKQIAEDANEATANAE
jgi:hypothetical protein